MKLVNCFQVYFPSSLVQTLLLLMELQRMQRISCHFGVGLFFCSNPSAAAAKWAFSVLPITVLKSKMHLRIYN